jgi:2-oxo-4-hydroxy-4-carboxy-5-ureidoimidazoline decarboxylase
MTITAFHQLEESEKKTLLRQCCGSSAWIKKMLHMPHTENLNEILIYAEEKWNQCSEEDGREAFQHHPKIGDISALRQKFSSDRFARSEQSSINQASENSLQLLADANKLYEEKFGYIFIVCATGKSIDEMLELLIARLRNLPAEEIKIAMNEQNKITKLRLQKLFECSSAS